MLIVIAWPPAGTENDAGDILKTQRPSCVIEIVWPATVRDTTRVSVEGLGATVKLMSPSPVPDALPLIVMAGSAAVTAQLQPEPCMTLTPIAATLAPFWSAPGPITRYTHE